MAPVIFLKRAAHVAKRFVPVPVRRELARAGNFMGLGLPTEVAFPSIFLALKTLQALGARPSFCVDVGAYHGEWTKLFLDVFPESHVLMLEAQESKRARLEEFASTQAGRVTMEVALLGAKDGVSVQFHEMETGSSVFEENSHFPRTSTARTTKTLDSVLESTRSPKVDFLKLDVQGYELEILRGGTRALKEADAVLLEASLVPINRGCPLIADVMAFMSGAGFNLFDFCSQTRRRDGVLWQTDLLFLRSNTSFSPPAALSRKNWG
jgi:FkbM family methyltransferase